MDYATALRWAVFFALFYALRHAYRSFLRAWLIGVYRQRAEPPFRFACIAYGLALPILAYVQWGAIDSAASSTAALGYVFVPVVAAVESLFFGLIGYALGASLQAWHSRERRHLLRALLAWVLTGLGLTVFGYSELHEKSLIETVEAVRKMDDAGLQSFLSDHPHRSSLYALGAVAMNPLASGPTLSRIASMNDRALHQRLGGSTELMGANRKGLAVMRLVVKHANVTPATLELLASSPDAYVQADVAGNSRTPPWVLERLYRDQQGGENFYLMETGLAANPVTPGDILREIAMKTRREMALRAIANNAAAPPELRDLAAQRLRAGDFKNF